MAPKKHEQERREEQSRQAQQRTPTNEEQQNIMPHKQAMSHLGQEKVGNGRQAPIKSKTPGNSRGRKNK